MKPIIYISGPFSHEDTLHGIDQNILTASKYALECWKKGYFVICPHKNTSGFQHCDLPYETWIEGDLAFIDRMEPLKGDALLMLPGWEKSNGAVKERKFALTKGLKIYHVFEEIP